MPQKHEEEEPGDVKDESIKSEEETVPTVGTDATQKHAAKRRTKTGCLSEYEPPLIQTGANPPVLTFGGIISLSEAPVRCLPL